MVFLFCSLAFASITPDTTNATTDLVFDGRKQAYNLDRPIVVRIGLQNRGKLLQQLQTTGQAIDHLQLEAWSKSNKPLRLHSSIYDEQWNRFSDTTARPPTKTMNLYPGSTWQLSVALDEWIDFPGPGDYLVKATFFSLPLWLSPKYRQGFQQTPIPYDSAKVKKDEQRGSIYFSIRIEEDEINVPSLQKEGRREFREQFQSPHEAIGSFLEGRMALNSHKFLAPLDIEHLIKQYPTFHNRYINVVGKPQDEILKTFHRHLKKNLLKNVVAYDIKKVIISEKEASALVHIRASEKNTVYESYYFRLRRYLSSDGKGYSWQINQISAHASDPVFFVVDKKAS